MSESITKINKEISTKLIWLVFMYILGFALFFTVNALFDKAILQYKDRVENLSHKIEIGKYLSQDLYMLKSNFYELEILGNSKASRKIINRRIRSRIETIKDALKVLQNGGVYKRVIKLNLVNNSQEIKKIVWKKEGDQVSLVAIDLNPKLLEFLSMTEQLNNFLKQKMYFHKNQKPDLEKSMQKKITGFIKTIPAFFNRMIENNQRLLYSSGMLFQKLDNKIILKIKEAQNRRVIIILLIITFILVLSYKIIEDIEKSNEELKILNNKLLLEKKFTKAILNSQESITVVTNGNKILDINNSFFQKIQRFDSREDFFSKHKCVCDLFEENVPDEESYIVNKSYDGKNWLEYAYENRDKKFKVIINNGVEDLHFSLSVVKIDTGENDSFKLASFTDITNVLTAQFKLAKLNENLENMVSEKTKELELSRDKAQESARLKSEFLANMSHEIRTPMNGIIGMSHLLFQTRLNKQQKEYLIKIDDSAKSLLEIINDILDFSKIEAKKLSIEKIEFNLFETINNIFNIVSYRAYEKNIELIVDYQADVGKKFYGDSIRVAQIITNLLTNAIKFTKKGEIVLTVTKISSKRVMFSVKDTGIGLSKEQLNGIFNPFSQADGSTTRKYGGTGLGLSICTQLCKMMNGSIRVESEEGEGSNFIFEIELLNRDGKKRLYANFKNKQILAVDDNRSWLRVIDNLLNSFGINVMCANSTEKVMDLVDNSNQNYDLILVDWDMSGVNIIDMIKRINATKSGSKYIIILNIFNKNNRINNLDGLGVKMFLHKPIDPSVLNDALSDIFYDTSKIDNIAKQSKQIPLKYYLRSLAGGNLLLAEDNKTNQEIIKGLLDGSGINIDIVDNGKKAIEAVKNKKFDLILMDIQMPIMDGYSAATSIREFEQTVPIVALSANAMNKDIKLSKEAGMNEHISKPIDIEKLYGVLLKFIPKRVDISDKFIKEIETNYMPVFDNIDTSYGLKLIGGNEKLYTTILKGLLEYKDIELENLDDEELRRVAHTIKGISGSAGAFELQEIAQNIQNTLDRTLFGQFYEVLYYVIQEIEEKIIDLDVEQKEKITIEANQEEKDEIFARLKDALHTRRIQKCKPIVEEIHKYNLSAEEEKFFSQIEMYLKQFKFKEALGVYDDKK